MRLVHLVLVLLVVSAGCAARPFDPSSNDADDHQQAVELDPYGTAVERGSPEVTDGTQP